MASRYPVTVDCQPAVDGWLCHVVVGDDPGRTSHEVTVSATDLLGLAPGSPDPTALVAASFDFLLAREPRESILRRFDLPAIGRYFPDFPSRIRRPGAGDT